MAPRKTTNPGKTARFYRKNPTAYRKKLAKQSEENSKPENKKYKMIEIGEGSKLLIWGIVTYVIKSLK